MARMVNCVKLGREAEGLDRPPLPGELGKRIYENVSKEAWQAWQTQQTRLITELTEMHEAQAYIRETTEAQAPRLAKKSRPAAIAMAGRRC